MIFLSMNLSTIEQGEELYRLVSGASYSPSANKAFSTWLQVNASELLQIAREVEELKKKVENLQWHYNDMQSRNPEA